MIAKLKSDHLQFYFWKSIHYQEKNLPKGPSPTEYIGGIEADQLSKMAATTIGPKKV